MLAWSGCSGSDLRHGFGGSGPPCSGAGASRPATPAASAATRQALERSGPLSARDQLAGDPEPPAGATAGRGLEHATAEDGAMAAAAATLANQRQRRGRLPDQRAVCGQPARMLSQRYLPPSRKYAERNSNESRSATG